MTFNRSRYYSYALSEEDKEALRNRQHRREWTVEDVMSYRNELDKIKAPSFDHRDTLEATEDDSVEQERDTEQSVNEAHRVPVTFRAIDNLLLAEPPSPDTQSSGANITVSPPTPPPPVQASDNSTPKEIRIRGSNSKVSARLVSGAGRTVTPPSFRRNPEVTFDSILANHISGNGKSFRGAENTAKEEDDGGKRSNWRRGRWSSGRVRHEK
ncbi:hypothetical protein DM02DRAFT_705882 [Periconia macrospinosa]|uniref:Uncharacterized protein n=1 Tax=Periconia macrospinosa TaxID=97972 RepID=A0A2V1E9R9_9PLEO|nr:hypothetical protein DM02DRAFT_705882 [Periconia macrospinosa]